MKHISQRDIAKQLGVNVSTVSRALAAHNTNTFLYFRYVAMSHQPHQGPVVLSCKKQRNKFY